MAQTTNSIARSDKKRGPPTLIKYYLVVYNVLSAVGWSYVLALTVAHLAGLDVAATAVHQSRVASYIPASVSQYLPIVSRLAGSTHHYEKQLPAALVPLFRRACSTYAVVGLQTSFVQSFALLEVLHSLLGWVRSPLGTTMAQVASRLYLVWGVTALFPETHTHPLYASMVLSWSLTEVVRYVFYACSLLGREPRALLWLRYTLFYVLYPSGAGSEAGLIYASLPSPPPSIPLLSSEWYGWALPLSWPFATPRWTQALHDDLRCVLFLIWWPGLYIMYTHMMKQRRKVLGGRTLGAKPKTRTE
ncbi:hypothetical protein POSPLADRAFT_1132827 [Postia placenta MAD-698-R-SB12]|uniref:Very-long-chain (3R)-3-hydroxyacyl-CoA dehydratase n=1 Tax=Postia placenta MAD-698-R-SB12 TaxID=670580 RepID=A0A1X6NBT1_9APHY|nr:hypothetical protein POSPLADRAFT_1132827 [Postia placenta MAD-698-R-SB12]OSX66099.1 hypothetical protein POSPLADRAFT_1132827 [Postia placenta MAD-698-R-SB12]